MITTDNKLELAIYLYRKTHPSLNSDRNWEGILSEEEDFSVVMEAIERHEMRGMVCEPESRKFDFQAPPGRFFASLSDFLLLPQKRTTVPAEFYIADLDYYHPKDLDKCPDIIRRYIVAVNLFDVIERKFSDDVRTIGSEKTLVFLGQRKLEITAEFEEEDLKNLEEQSAFIEDFALSTVHVQQKKTIFSSALFHLFEGKNKVKFSELLAIFGKLIEDVNAGYQLYVSEFSFQKVRAEVEREKLEFTTKLNKVFSDIQNQLLAIPAALILVGGQIKQADSLTPSNLLIWLGALVFSILMRLLIGNQRNTLAAIKGEIDHQWDLIEGEHKSVAGKFKDSYEGLEKRYVQQQRLLSFVWYLVISGLVLSTIILAWYSGFDFNQCWKYAFDSVKSILGQLCQG